MTEGWDSSHSTWLDPLWGWIGGSKFFKFIVFYQKKLRILFNLLGMTSARFLLILTLPCLNRIHLSDQQHHQNKCCWLINTFFLVLLDGVCVSRRETGRKAGRIWIRLAALVAFENWHLAGNTTLKIHLHDIWRSEQREAIQNFKSMILLFAWISMDSSSSYF